MPRFRFTVRRLMVAVAIAAAICGGEVLRRRRAAFLERAAEASMFERIYVEDVPKTEREIARTEGQATAHRRSALEYRKRAATGQGTPELQEINADTEEKFAQNADEAADDFRSLLLREREIAKFHGNLRRKYERAARYPWLPVAPDPPEPKD